jgi:hypothetical protein
VSGLIPAPIDEVFAFFDDPDNTLEFNDHAESFTLVEVQPDGRRTIDIAMRSGSASWVQTYEQVIREPPVRLVTEGHTWTTDRDRPTLALVTDRRLSAEGDGTRLSVTVGVRTPGRPVQSVLNWIRRGAFKAELEHQLSAIAERFAAGPRSGA